MQFYKIIKKNAKLTNFGFVPNLSTTTKLVYIIKKTNRDREIDNGKLNKSYKSLRLGKSFKEVLAEGLG